MNVTTVLPWGAGKGCDKIFRKSVFYTYGRADAIFGTVVKLGTKYNAVYWYKMERHAQICETPQDAKSWIDKELAERGVYLL